MREGVLPVLEAGGVDLVLAGHSHAYERSHLLAGHYGSASTFDHPAPSVGIPERGWLVLDIAPKSITGEFLSDAGEELDRFRLRRLPRRASAIR